jgi:hypothetical protein
MNNTDFRYYQVEGVYGAMPSVTSILHEFLPEADALRWWKENNPDWKEIMNYRASVGTLTHHMIAEHLSSRFGLPKPEPLEMKITPQMEIEAGAAMSYFDDFVSRYELEPDAIEEKVWHRIMKYAGTLDYKGKIHYKGKCRKVILDWKTSSNIWESHELQTVAYKQAILSDVNCKDNIDACGVVIVNPIKGLKIGRIVDEKLAWDGFWECFDKFQRIFRTTEEIVTKDEAGYK